MTDGRWLALILALAMLHGMIYIYLMPPFQHYDEPNHFEYAWLVAHLDHWPVYGDYDPELSRQVVQSMVENDFFHNSQPPELGSPGQEVKIPGFTQLYERPFYYWLVSLPLRLVSDARIEAQLFTARLVSLLLYLLAIVAAWGAIREITLPGHPLRWMVPITLAMLPAFTDLMTAVNNDAAAVAIFSWFFWGCLRLLRKPFNLLNLSWVLAAAALAYWVKSTALVSLFLLPFVILYAVLRGKWRKVAWALVAVGILILLAVTFNWGEPAAWHRAISQDSPTRQLSEKAPLGDHVLVVETGAQVLPVWSPPLFQLIPLDWGEQLIGQDVTLGAWMWASQPVSATLPILKTPGYATSNTVSLSETPAFFAFHSTMPADASRTWIYLKPKAPGSQPVTVYYDGLVLALGKRPLSEPPRFDAPDGIQGKWGGEPFTNLLRNASAESPSLRINPLVDNLTTRLLPDRARLSLLLGPMLDFQASGPYLKITIRHLFRTFWARFGWGHVPLLGAYSYKILLAATLVSFLGILIGFWRHQRCLPWDVIVLSILGIIFAWSLTLARGFVFLSQPNFYVSTARHASPVIVPVVMFLTFGWHEIMQGIGRLFPRLSSRPDVAGEDRTPGVMLALYVIFFLALDVFSIISVASYYGYI